MDNTPYTTFLLEQLSLFCPLPSSFQVHINKNFSAEHWEEWQVLQAEKQPVSCVWFVVCGCLRLRMYKRRKSEYITVRLWLPGEWATVPVSFFQRQKSNYIIDALEETHVFSVSLEDITRALLLYPSETFALVVALLAECVKKANEQADNFANLSAWERYQELIKKYPPALQRMSLKEIAGLLRVSREELSRLRNR